MSRLIFHSSVQIPQQVVIEVESHEMTDAMDVKTQSLPESRARSSEEISDLPQQKYKVGAAFTA